MWEKWAREYKKVMTDRTGTTGMKAEFEKMAGGAEKLAQENGAMGRFATSQEMAETILHLNSNMASFVSGLMMVVDMGHNAAKALGLAKNQLNGPAALPLHNTKFMQKKFREQI